jgi:Lipopolysaccharide-assembly
VKKSITRPFCFYLLPFALAASLLAACGYQFQVEGPGPTIGGGAAPSQKPEGPKLAIPLFINKSFEPNLETKYTIYTRHEFAAGSGAQVVSDSEGADMVLTGQIIAVSLPTLSFSVERTFESRVTVFASATVDDKRTGKTLWRQSVTASSEFFVTDDLQFNRVLQTRALEQAGRLMAEDLAMRFLDHLESGALEQARTSKEGFVPEKPRPGQLPPQKGTR